MPRMLLLAVLIAAVPALVQAQPDKSIRAAAKPAASAPPGDLTGAAAKKRKSKPDPVSDLPSGPKAVVGSWVMAHDGEGAANCRLRLDAPGVIGGFRLVAPKTCKAVLDGWDELYAWYVTTDGDLVMANVTRETVLRFRRLGDGDWATGDDDDRLLLIRASKVGITR